MALFLPLVVYTATRKRYGDWPNNPYSVEKTRFLADARQKLTPFYEHVKRRIPDCVTFGVKNYREEFSMFETDLAKKPRLSSDLISNNCTLLICDPRDLLRTKREIESDHQDADQNQIEDIIASEIIAIETFLGKFTPFIFVPGFSFAPYRDTVSEDLPNLARKYHEFFESNMGLDRNGNVKYQSYDDDLLLETSTDLMDLQDKARAHLQVKLEKLKEAADKRRRD